MKGRTLTATLILSVVIFTSFFFLSFLQKIFTNFSVRICFSCNHFPSTLAILFGPTPSQKFVQFPHQISAIFHLLWPTIGTLFLPSAFGCELKRCVYVQCLSRSFVRCLLSSRLSWRRAWQYSCKTGSQMGGRKRERDTTRKWSESERVRERERERGAF